MKEYERMEAKSFLPLLLYFIFLVYALVYEPNNLVVTHNDFELLDDGGPVRIAFISDIHALLQKDGWLDTVVDRVNQQKPDIVLIGGDFVEGDDSELPLLSPLGRIEAPYGAYAVLGNHDYGWWACPAPEHTADAIESGLEGMGIDVLRNENRILDVRGSRIALIGVDEKWVCRDDYSEAAGGIPEGMPKIVLVHNLNAVEPASLGGHALVLSGHTHCGLIRAPYITELLLGTELAAGRRDYGEGTEAYVTCGVTGGGLRFLTSPEISMITLK